LSKHSNSQLRLVLRNEPFTFLRAALADNSFCRQFCCHRRDSACRIGMGEGAGLGGHAFEGLPISEENGQGLQEHFRGEAAFEEQGSRACFDQRIGVFALVVISSLGKRDEQRRLPCRGQFGYGAGTAPGEDEIGGFEAAGHVVEEGVDLPAIGRSVTGLVGGEGGFGVTGSGLMQDGEAGHGGEQRRRDPRQERVEDAGTLTASEDEQVRRRAGGTGREAEEFIANGDAGDLRVAEVSRGGGKVNCGGIYALADKAVGEAREGVWFEGKRRNAPENGCPHGWSGGVAADSDDDVGAEITQQLAAADKAEGKVEQCARFGQERDVFKLAYLDE